MFFNIFSFNLRTIFFSIEFEFNPIQSYSLIMKFNMIIKIMKFPTRKLKVIPCNQNPNIQKKIIQIHPMNEHRYQVSNPPLIIKNPMIDGSFEVFIMILILLWCGCGNVTPHSNYLIFPNGNNPLSYGNAKFTH